MRPHTLADFHATDVIGAIVIAVLFISAASLLKEPNRKQFMAIMIAGAGAAYLNGGLGVWEFVFTTIVTYCAYQGLSSYRFIGVGWLLHTGWDVVHHLYGNPIVPFAPTSSFGCAICDLVIAAWCFAGAPSTENPERKGGSTIRQSEEGKERNVELQQNAHQLSGGGTRCGAL